MRMQGLVRWMAGAVAVLAVALAHAEPPWASHPPAGRAAGPRWGLRAPAEAFYPPGAYRLVGDEMREPSRASAGFANTPPPLRGGSIRDAVTRYSEERGGFADPPRQAPRGNNGQPQEKHRH
jgi:hypothetical protein